MSKQLINELGNKYGLLTVIGKDKDKNNRTIWICKCECGNIKQVKGSDLRAGKITTCGAGCPLKFLRNSNFKNLIGQKFGRLTVLSFKEINKNHKSVWHCKCDCGKECDVIGTQMENGYIQSCGCLHTEKMQQLLSNSIIGKRYGKLIVIDKDYDLKHHLIWKCQCDCGNFIYLSGAQLTGERGTRSCGCIKSSYELKIKQILEKLQIKFQSQQKFSDLKDIRQLSYDFGIYKNNKIIGLIEYQGDQHFKPIEYYGGEEQFKIQQKHDKIKFYYAKIHHIPLLYLSKKDNDILENKIKEFLSEECFYEI